MLSDDGRFLATRLSWKQVPQGTGWLLPSNKKTNQWPGPTDGASRDKPHSETFKMTRQHLEQHNFVFKYNH